MWAIVLSLIPLICWGTADYIASKYSKSLHPATINLFFVTGALVVAIAVSVVMGLPDFSALELLKYFGVSIVLTAGFMSMVKAFSVGATGIVASLSNSYVVLTTIIAILFLGKTMTISGAIAVLVIVFGIALLTYKKDPNHNKKDFRVSIIFASMALVFFGVGFALFDVVASQKWYQNSLLFQMSGIVVAMLVYIILVKKNHKAEISLATKRPLMYAGALVGGIGTAGLFGALALADNVAIPASVAAAAPLMTAFLAYKYDREHLTSLQRIAAVVIVMGIILLSIYS